MFLKFLRKFQPIDLWVDMDGTIADIHSFDDWPNCDKHPEYFLEFEPFSNLISALFLIKKAYGKKVRLGIISSAYKTSLEEAKMFKNNWTDENCSVIQKNRRVYSICGEPKTKYIKNISKRSILLDDHSPNLLDWVRNGGKAVKIKNNINCSGKNWTGDIIYNQDSIESIYEQLAAIIEEAMAC